MVAEALPVTALLLLSSAVASSEGAAGAREQRPVRSACEEQGFACGDDGPRVLSWLRCSGTLDCPRGEDEALCSAANATLDIGDVLKALVLVGRAHVAPVFLLCDGGAEGAECSRLALTPRDSPYADGRRRVAFSAGTGCNHEGFDCAATKVFDDARELLPFWLDEATVFVVERRPYALAVWVSGSPGHVAAVRAPSAGPARLRVRPLCWVTGMEARLAQAASPSPTPPTADDGGAA